MNSFPKLYTLTKTDFQLYLTLLRKITIKISEKSKTDSKCCLS